MKGSLASVGLLVALALALAGPALIGGSEGIASIDARAFASGPGGPVIRVSRDAGEAPARPRHRRIPSAAALRDARRFAESRTGLVSFAAVNSAGQLRGFDAARTYVSASVVKSMLLAAELERWGGGELDGQTDDLLRAMITASDNDAADAIYARVGDAGLFAVAERAGMSQFSVAGYWGNAQIAAGDMALMFSRLNRVFRGPHREYALGLLGSIIPAQSWGIPDAAGGEWAVRFKGGWLPDRGLVHQAAELHERDGRRELSIAVLTDAGPSFEYGMATIRGIAARLLGQTSDGNDR